MILLFAACYLLHNFIRKTNLYDDDFTYTQEEDDESDDEEEVVAAEDADEADEFREAVAHAMWAQYLASLLMD